MTVVDVVRLGPSDAVSIATLLAAHLHEQRGGSPPRPDRYHAEKLLCADGLDLLGARLDGELIGVAVVHELGDSLSGARFGLIETVYVRPDRRGRGVGRSLLDGVGDLARRRAWSRITRAEPAPPRFAERSARPRHRDRDDVAPLSRVVPLSRQ